MPINYLTWITRLALLWWLKVIEQEVESFYWRQSESRGKKDCVLYVCVPFGILIPFYFFRDIPKGAKLFHLFGGRSSDSRPFCGWCLLNWAFIRHLNWFGWSTGECSTQVKSTIKCHSRPFSWKQQFLFQLPTVPIRLFLIDFHAKKMRKIHKWPFYANH